MSVTRARYWISRDRCETDLIELLRPDVADRVLSNTPRTAKSKGEILLTSARGYQQVTP